MLSRESSLEEDRSTEQVVAWGILERRGNKNGVQRGKEGTSQFG